MGALRRLRVIRHARVASAMNMAVDDALLETPTNPADYTLRFYRWLRPTVSIGYGQEWRSGFDARLARRHGMALVRRRTGGRSVLHAGELTYSIAGGTEEGPFAGGIQATYSVIAEGLVAGLGRLGIEAEIVRSRGRRDRAEPGACFASRALNELVTDGRKLVGSAQRRAGGRALQHGSILMDRPDPALWAVLGSTGPDAARASVGVNQLLGTRVSLRRICGFLAAGVADRLDATIDDGVLTQREMRAAAARERSHADPAFIRRR